MPHTPGIRPRHSRHCPAGLKRDDRHTVPCRCTPSYRAEVYLAREGRKLRKTFSGPGAFAAAKAWRVAALAALNRGELRSATRRTLRETADKLLVAMEAGEVRAKGGGRPYKPSAIASYRTSLQKHVLPDLGAHRLSDITATDVQALVDHLVRERLSGQTVRNAVVALAAVYRFARRRGWATTNPARDLELPAAGRRRERVVDPGEARELLEPLPVELRALYGVAIYAGLRRGEIAGLRWQDIRFDDGATGGTITVERSFCYRTRRCLDPKTDRARRRVPIVGPLAESLLAWSVEHPGGDVVFPSARDRSRPFDPVTVRERAEAAWKRAAQKRAIAAGQDPDKATWNRILLHEGRHSAASAFIAAGEDVVQVAAWLGHSQTSTTMDIYAKALRARERAAADRVDAFYREWASPSSMERDIG